MKLLINTSTLSSTGVVQVAVSFLEECKSFDKSTLQFLVITNSIVNSQIDVSEYPSNFTFHEVKINPNKIIRGYSERKRIKKLEKKWKPDCVFSVFGPSYWTPTAPHLMGYAYPHYVYPESPFFRKINLIDKLKTLLYKHVHKFFLNRNGKYFVSETEDVAKRVVDYLKINASNSFVVSNTCNKYFISTNEVKKKLLQEKGNNEFRFLSLCSLAPHKNLEILNDVIPHLRNRNIRFVLTVDPALFQEKFTSEAKDMIINLGRINIADCPTLYQECDALFLPTLLECYTANYPEAMKMGKPILTSDLSFATSVCQDAALYFDPLNAKEIAQKIEEIIGNTTLRTNLVINGTRLSKLIPTANQRAKSYIEICKEILKRDKYDRTI